LLSIYSALKTTINICPRCQGNGANNYLSNKRRCGFDDFFEIDGGDTLTSQMDKLSIEKVRFDLLIDFSFIYICILENW
jgi:hypothetical protein